MNLKETAPSIASLANAAAGFTACALALVGSVELGALVVLVAVLLDSLDGALARSLDADSDFGAELDSLADVVSFGVAPALLVAAVLPPGLRTLGWCVVSLYPLCIIWRLARFNTRQASPSESKGRFCGLPSTGAGAAVATAVMVYVQLAPAVRFGAFFLPSMLALLGALAVSKITYWHAGVVVSRLTPSRAALLAIMFVLGSIVWEYEYMFGALTWGYVLSGPLVVATEKIRAVRHA